MRKQVDLQLPKVQLAPIASPVAPLKAPQVQAPVQTELSRLARGFGGLVPALADAAERAQKDEVVRVDSEVRALPFDELTKMLDSDELKSNLGIRFEASLLAAEGRIGQRLAEGFTLSHQTIVALGDPLSFSREDKSAMIDAEIKAHVDSLPPVSSPFVLAGFREGMAAVKSSALADGERRSASQAERNLVVEIRDEARDAVFAAGMSEVEGEYDFSGLLDTVSTGLPQHKQARTDGIVLGLASLAGQDSDRALALTKELRERKIIDSEDVDSVKSSVLASWNREYQLKNFGKSAAQAEAADALDSFVLQVLRTGASEATNHQELSDELRTNPKLGEQMSKLRERFSDLSSDEWDSLVLKRLDAIPQENNRIQAQLDRNNKKLPEEIKTEIIRTRGVQSDYDKIADPGWTFEQKTLADSLYDRSKRQYQERVDSLIQDKLGDRRFLSSADRVELDRLLTQGETTGIGDLLAKAADAYRNPKTLWEYTAGEAARDQFYTDGAAQLLSQFNAEREELGGEPQDFTLEDAKAEYARIIESRIASDSPGWITASNEERGRILNARTSRRVDLIEDTQVDDWIRLHATGDRNTRINPDGSYVYTVENMTSEWVDASLGEYRSDLPELGDTIQGIFQPGIFESANPEKLREEMSSPEFRRMLEQDPRSREIVSNLLSKGGSVTAAEIILDRVGEGLIEGGIPLSLALPTLPGTRTPDLGAFWSEDISTMLAPAATGGKLDAPGELLRAKLIEISGLDEANFDKALPGLIKAHQRESGKSRVNQRFSVMIDLLRTGTPAPSWKDITLPTAQDAQNQ